MLPLLLTPSCALALGSLIIVYEHISSRTRLASFGTFRNIGGPPPYKQHLNKHMYTYIHTHIHTHTYIYVYSIYIYSYLCASCIYIYIFIFIIHIHIYI